MEIYGFESFVYVFLFVNGLTRFICKTDHVPVKMLSVEMRIVKEWFFVTGNIGIGYQIHIHLVVGGTSQLIHIKLRFLNIHEIGYSFLFLLLDQLIFEHFYSILNFRWSSIEPDEHLHQVDSFHAIIKSWFVDLIDI